MYIEENKLYLKNYFSIKHDAPEQEVYRDPTIVREEDTTIADSSIAQQRHTASRMINVFKQMEEDLKTDKPQGTISIYILIGFIFKNS